MLNKLFFDLEFTGLHKNTTLISIGVTSEYGDKFYGICEDYDKSQVNDWIEENVIKNLGNSHRASTKDVGIALNKWLENYFKGSEIQFVSDVCHYDFVLLVDLLTNGGTAFDLPKNISPVCHDINQDIAEYLGITDREAFDLNREEFITSECKDLPEGDKHNSLYDALVIKQIYEIIENDNLDQLIDLI